MVQKPTLPGKDIGANGQQRCIVYSQQLGWVSCIGWPV